MRKSFIAWLFLGLLFFSFVVLPVAGRVMDNDEDEDDDDDDRRERKVEISVDQDSAEIESKSEVGDDESKLKFRIKAQSDEFLKFELKYSSESSSSESEFVYKVFLTDILQFSESGATPGYQAGEDTLIKTYTFGEDGQWQNLQHTSSDNVHTFTVTDGVFTAIATISSNVFNVSERLLTPKELKLEFSIENFDYGNNNETTLALVGIVQTESKREFEGDDDDDDDKDSQDSDDDDEEEVRVKVTEKDQIVSFTWEKFVTCDDKVVNVIASSLQNTSPIDDNDEDEEDRKRDDDDKEEAKKIVWTIDTKAQPSKCDWDPILGARTSVQSNSNMIIINLFLLGFLVLFSL